MLKTFNRTSRFLIEAICGLILIILVLGGVLAWKLSQGPIDLGRFIPSNDNGAYLFSPEIDLDISYRWLFLGKLKFQTIWIRKTAISITKTLNGSIQITGQQRQEKEKAGQNLTPATISLENIIYDLPEVDTLWIDRARIIYRDEIADKIQSFDPATFFIEMKSNRNERNLFGFLTFPFGSDSQDNTVKLNFSTQNNPMLLNMSGSLKDAPIDSFLQFMPALPAGFDINTVVSADIQAQVNNAWGLHQMKLNMVAPRGQINLPLNDKDTTFEFSDLSTKINHNPITDIATIENLSLKINNQTNVKITGDLVNAQDIESVSGTLNLSVQNLPQSYFKKYWPQSASDNGAYRWLVEKINGGTFNNLNITSVFDLAATTRADENPLPPQLISVKGDMIYDGLNIKYHPEMAIANNVSGAGTYDDIELTLNVDKADIGGMVTKDATLHFDDLITKGNGLGKLNFPVISDAQNVFDYIAGEPITAFKKTDFKPKNTKGDVDAIIDLEIPLLKDLPVEDIKVTVKGTVNNANIPNAVKGLTLSGGPYDIFATTEEIKVKGVGQLSGKPITLEWHEYFSAKPDRDYVSKVVASVTANDKIRRAFTNDFADYFRGDTNGDVTYIKSSNNRDATIDLKLDTTATNIIVPSLGVDKKSGQTSSATANVNLRNGDLTAVKNLKIKGRGFSIDKGDLSFRNVGAEPLITKGTLNNIAFNENRINVAMAEQNQVLKTTVTGKFLDARPILSRNKSDGDGQDNTGRAREYGVTVDEMRTADEYTVKSPEAYIRLDRTGRAEQFEMDAKLGEDGKYGDLYVRYTPEVSDGLTLRVESNNAGETLRAFDLYPHINGGELQIAGVPTAGGRFGDVRGKARIDNFDVANAPILLRLVNALSFQNFLRAGKLTFARLESDFEWTLGEKGDVYQIRNGTTSGASVALTFDGFVDTATDNMEITGTAAPLSELNNFVGKIPLIGQILTGGDALLAATYSVKGNPSDPSVAVNPLSILTPGIIRKMLFENTPKAEDQDNKPQPKVDIDERTKGLN